jgi:DNA-binding Lrp family transcriptional regulator
MASLDDDRPPAARSLQDDGRMTNVDLAAARGPDPAAVPAPRARAGGKGVIRGYHADLDASKLGYTITVFAMVSLKSQAEECAAPVRGHMRALPEVRECHMLNGEIDFILKIVSRTCKASRNS